ncbi:SdpI family protein [Flavobacterium litorale]|uniref:SdpI family protein n=1 Tax=Flavobacterium litorale TaxID=2856519 RepID=A0ABX8V862_9FLAO|nr:SdpI family protein [Flavobacterium litorale]QYJ69049.1 SdpI family protein [Flavobacterium litorale]
MQDILNAITSIFFLSGFVLLVTAILMHFFPPKKINDLYGYRSKRSKQSQENWDFAQKFSTKQMLKVAIFMLISGGVNAMLDLEQQTEAIFGILMLLVGMAYLFYTTENELKNRSTD